ncbi:3-phenylpropionate/cinnamic acid dioxygenase subunit beta [Paraburkholderia sp. LEh10]|jgi:3-phenylpropionate/trans-cinnamate dioxygenase beta subunit|uniref:3-phenylpropionate/cinnamic acid dioxygenase subunit beta n=1 Tax=Paraburkholderia sp. LEh10 TaxID=2821353 RepID=UPI001AEB6DDB|nr:3-phenylpropionate/cinnamic acid dioxygenase subunit beta [Paraburkholderia sp. LEh10]MBP0594262.1 3-phenylpropionate/cinnamic acid dioxygenase subunit beta [Paraburkholderia sp. LEh10]
MTDITFNRPQTVSFELHHEIEQFLYHEAELLDDWHFRDWLELMSPDVHYAMRTTVNAQTRDRRRSIQPPTTWIFNDTYAQLERRIARLETGMAWAEEPPSRTRHLATNVVVMATDQAGEFDIRLNYLLYRSQKERDEAIYVGKRLDRIRRTDTPAGWQVCRREITLDQATLNSHNLSILF